MEEQGSITMGLTLAELNMLSRLEKGHSREILSKTRQGHAYTEYICTAKLPGSHSTLGCGPYQIHTVMFDPNLLFQHYGILGSNYIADQPTSFPPSPDTCTQRCTQEPLISSR